MTIKNLILIRNIVTVITLFIPLSGLASPETEFNEGVEFYNAGNYSSAIDNFQSAEKLGLISVTLHYHLARSYFQLEKYALARKYFNRVALMPEMNDRAEYNLGLIFLHENFSIEARYGVGIKDSFLTLKTTSNNSDITLASKIGVKVDRLMGIYAVGHMPMGKGLSIYGQLGYVKSQLIVSMTMDYHLEWGFDRSI